jgi:hypothetical protein
VLFGELLILRQNRRCGQHGRRADAGNGEDDQAGLGGVAQRGLDGG